MAKTKFLLPIFIALFSFSCQNETTTVRTSNGEEEISTDELLQILGESYIYGYPTILMEYTQKISTNIETPHPSRPIAPINQLGHFRTFPDHTLTAVVKPNVDTYYSIAWMDLGEEPLVLSIPATERYYLMPIMDAYSNVFASPGTRTTGTDAQTFLIAGPNWDGEVPDGQQLIQSPTVMAWMIGRIQVNSPEDGATVVKDIQDELELVPLSAFGKADYIAPKGKYNETYKNIIPVKKVRELDINTYFNQLSELMVDNPPPLADSLMLKRMAKIGFEPGKPFHLSSDNLILKLKLKELPNFIHEKFEERKSNPDTSLMTNNWMIVKDGIGTYGADYRRRAYIDFIALGANTADDAIYPNCSRDKNGNPLDGKNKYKIHFDKNQIPPVNAFWSLTAYNADEFLIKNDLNRFALGDRDSLIYNEDGSLDLYVQAKPPENKFLPNWLPSTSEGKFSLTMRLFWPKEDVFNGEWEIPFVEMIEE